jgi:hypothetical protein
MEWFMTKRRGSVLVGLLLAIMMVSQAEAKPRQPKPATGAQISEPDQFDKVLHVSPSGSDKARGTRDQPFGDLQKAVRQLFNHKKAGRDVKLVLADGVYRQTFKDWRPIRNDAVAVIEAAHPRKAILKGSDVWTGWQAHQGRWVHHWPYDWGPDGRPGPPGLVQRSEMIFVDGRLMRQVLKAQDLAPGTFHVDETRNRVVIDPPSEARLKQARIEVATRTRLGFFAKKRNVIVRGLKITHSRADGAGSIKFRDSDNLLIEDCMATWNNLSGFRMQFCNDVTYRNTVANHNGVQGFMATRIKNVRYEDCEQSYNCWRTDWAGRGGWGTSKWMHAHRLTLDGFRAVGNRSPGIWVDIDNTDVLIQEAYVVGNRGRGIFLEASQGPLAVRRSLIANTKAVPRGDQFMFHGGISISTSRHVTIENNILYNNHGRPEFGIHAQLWIHDLPNRTGEEIYNFENKDGPKPNLKPAHIRIRRNVLITRRGQTMMAVPPRNETWQDLFATLDIDENVYYPAGSSELTGLFKVIAGLGEADGSQPPTVKQRLSLSQWQRLTGQDKRSRLAKPRFRSVETLDFRRQSGSPVAEWNLPTGRGDRP